MKSYRDYWDDLGVSCLKDRYLIETSFDVLEWYAC